MKHKHAELIKAWADGAEIQWRSETYTNNLWVEARNPSWDNACEFRIKPKQPVVRWMWAWEEYGMWCFSDTFMTEKDAKELEAESKCRYIKLDWSRTEFPE